MIRFFDMLNRWEVAVATLVIVAALNLGLYFFYYLPNKETAPASPLPEGTIPSTLQSTAPTTRMENTVPRRTKTASPPGKKQY